MVKKSFEKLRRTLSDGKKWNRNETRTKKTAILRASLSLLISKPIIVISTVIKNIFSFFKFYFVNIKCSLCYWTKILLRNICLGYLHSHHINARCLLEILQSSPFVGNTSLHVIFVRDAYTPPILLRDVCQGYYSPLLSSEILHYMRCLSELNIYTPLLSLRDVCQGYLHSILIYYHGMFVRETYTPPLSLRHVCLRYYSPLPSSEKLTLLPITMRCLSEILTLLPYYYGMFVSMHFYYHFIFPLNHSSVK